MYVGSSTNHCWMRLDGRTRNLNKTCTDYKPDKTLLVIINTLEAHIFEGVNELWINIIDSYI
jgi:hypothetical protein